MFWTNSNFLREPLRSNRWFIRFGDAEGLDDFVYGLKECNKPSFDISVTEHRHISGHVFRLPGTLKWKPITIKFAAITNQYDSTTIYSDLSLSDRIILDIIGEVYVKPPKTKGTFERISLSRVLESKQNKSIDSYQNIQKSQGYFFESIELIQIDNDGHEQEKWKLNNCFISNINYGNLSYGSDDIVEISVTLQYDSAEQRDNKYYNKNSQSQIVYKYDPPDSSS